MGIEDIARDRSSPSTQGDVTSVDGNQSEAGRPVGEPGLDEPAPETPRNANGTRRLNANIHESRETEPVSDTPDEGTSAPGSTISDLAKSLTASIETSPDETADEKSVQRSRVENRKQARNRAAREDGSIPVSERFRQSVTDDTGAQPLDKTPEFEPKQAMNGPIDAIRRALGL
jgi:hypothetical protein